MLIAFDKNVLSSFWISNLNFDIFDYLRGKKVPESIFLRFFFCMHNFFSVNSFNMWMKIHMNYFTLHTFTRYAVYYCVPMPWLFFVWAEKIGSIAQIPKYNSGFFRFYSIRMMAWKHLDDQKGKKFTFHKTLYWYFVDLVSIFFYVALNSCQNATKNPVYFTRLTQFSQYIFACLASNSFQAAICLCLLYFSFVFFRYFLICNLVLSQFVIGCIVVLLFFCVFLLLNRIKLI